jgi:hypothetical protein
MGIGSAVPGAAVRIRTLIVALVIPVVRLGGRSLIPVRVITIHVLFRRGLIGSVLPGALGILDYLAPVMRPRAGAVGFLGLGIGRGGNKGRGGQQDHELFHIVIIYSIMYK